MAIFYVLCISIFFVLITCEAEESLGDGVLYDNSSVGLQFC